MSEPSLKDTLKLLHSAVAKHLLDRVRTEDCPAAILKEARELLKDNGIECDGKNNAEFTAMAEEMADLDLPPTYDERHI